MQLPAGFFFAGAAYTFELAVTFPITGTDGSQVLTQGEIFGAINITLPS